MRVVRNSIFPLGSWKAMALGPFIFIRKGAKELSDVDINHEAIHWEQQKELLIVFFLVFYALLMLWELVRCIIDSRRGRKRFVRRNLWMRAYHSIVFEREAYIYEKHDTYLCRRQHFAWLHL